MQCIDRVPNDLGVSVFPDGRQAVREGFVLLCLKCFLPCLLFLCLGTNAIAQWHKIRDFIGTDGGQFTGSELITCVYFIDLPGPPRIGFAGTESELWKTTDGGSNWRDVFPHLVGSLGDVVDISFKDSVTGWMSYSGVDPGLYMTTDGGNNWFLEYPNKWGIECVHYCKSSNRLFFATLDTLHSSTDLGKSWSVEAVTVVGFSFSSNDTGIAAGIQRYKVGTPEQYDSSLILRTSDGGQTWLRSYPGFGCTQPLAVPGSPICYGVTANRIRVFRSDDYGKTWRQIADFGNNVDSLGQLDAPAGSGYIAGDLSRLYIGTDSGMFVSTDSGFSWFNDKGPPDAAGGYPNGFYASKGLTMAGWWAVRSSVGSDGLWEETWPQSGVTQPSPAASANISVYPNPTTGMVTITGASGPVEVENILGERISIPGSIVGDARTTVPGTRSLDLSRLPSGTYFVRIETTAGIVVRRVVKE